MAIPTWVDTAQFAGGDADITAYGRDKVGWTSTRGSTGIVQLGFTSDVGTYGQTLSNAARLFDPDYAAGANFGDLVPEVGFNKIATWAATDYPVFAGNIVDFPQAYPQHGLDQIVQIQAFDAIRTLAESQQIALSAPAEPTGTRISRILTAIGYPGPTDIATGVGIVNNIKKSSGSFTAMSHIADCVNAEWGNFYVQTDGTLIFVDRNGLDPTASPVATFTDTGTLKYSDIQRVTLPIVNDCTIVYNDRGRSVNFNDPTSIAAHGTKSLPLNLPIHTKAAAKEYARWVVGLYKEPVRTVSSITIAPGANPEVYFPEVLGRSLNDLITVVRTPRVNGVASTPISCDCWIRGISHSYSDHVWQSTTFYLQDASWLSNLFVWDVSEYDGTAIWGL